MKRFFAVLLLCIAVLTSCVVKDSEILEELTEDISLEEAKACGYVVHEDGDVTSGKEIFAEFLKKTEAGEAATVRLGFYYTLDRDRVTEEYYNEHKDRYPVLYISELIFDGKEYILRYFEDGKELRKKYAYMKYLPFYPKNVESDYEMIVHYVLLNDETVKSYDEIWRSLASSVMGDYIEHSTVYSEYISK